MNKSEEQQATRPYPHLAVALLLMNDNNVKTTKKNVKEISVTIEQTNLLTGELTPVRVVF